jgi:3-isopropylmalate/(R)-2-methylmalate dehydratase small subunit
MKPFRRVTSAVAILDRADVDTDQIVPKEFLKRIERTGFGEFLFYDWRYDAGRDLRLDFELNEPAAAGAKILIAGANFGCGSSREHAAWALQDYGFEVLIAPSFGDIFRTNCTKIGLVPVVLSPRQIDTLVAAVRRGAALTVDLEHQAISGAGGVITFEFDPAARESILHGLDDIARSLSHEDEIAAYEAAHAPRVDTPALARS